jgi:phytanoyl-CoA hydroxylase
MVRRMIPPVETSGFAERGYIVLADVFAPAELAGLRAEAAAVCRGKRGNVAGLAPSDPHELDDEIIRRYLCIHHPHKISPLLRATFDRPGIVATLTAIIGPNIKAMQSMLFIKAEGKPGQAWHQDEFFIPTRDRSLTAAWIALDDATVENGCVWVLPGSHRRGILYPDRAQDDARFDCTNEAHSFPYADEEAVPVELSAGSVVLFNGYLLHRSLPNTSPRFRRALVNHYMSAESLLPWGPVPDEDHVGKHDYRDVIVVAGTDPYAYKGTADIAVASVRATKDGGCGR